MDITLEELLAQEKRLQFNQFDTEAGLHIGLWTVDYARENDLPIVVDIWHGEHQLFHASLPGTNAGNDGWATRKARLVNKLKHSSFYFVQLLKSEGTTMEEKWQLSKDEYAAAGGCFPIIVAGEGIVGTIAISGLPQEDDHALAVQALETYLEIAN